MLDIGNYSNNVNLEMERSIKYESIKILLKWGIYVIKRVFIIVNLF